MLSPEGIAYLQKHAPIGCRDHYTLQLLQKHQIPAYFSGCLTLSLNRQGFSRPQQAPQEPYILLCSALERLNPKNNPSASGLGGLLNRLKNLQRAVLFQRANKRLETFLEQAQHPVVRRSQIVSVEMHSKEERSFSGGTIEMDCLCQNSGYLKNSHRTARCGYGYSGAFFIGWLGTPQSAKPPRRTHPIVPQL